MSTEPTSAFERIRLQREARRRLEESTTPIDPGPAGEALAAARAARDEGLAAVTRLERELTADAKATAEARERNAAALLKGGKPALEPIVSRAAEIEAALEMARSRIPALASAVKNAEDDYAFTVECARKQTDREAMAELVAAIERAKAEIAAAAAKLRAGEYALNGVKAARVSPVAPSNRGFTFVDGAPGRVELSFTVELESTPEIPPGVRTREQLAENARVAREARIAAREEAEAAAKAHTAKLSIGRQRGVLPLEKIA